MANTLLTLNDHSQRCTTQRDPANQNPADWVEAHIEQIKAAIAGGFILGWELVTSWDTANGRYQCPTSRNPGETDEEYFDRHFEAVATQMANNPPT